MSEGFDSQKKPNNNFRKLLQERIEKINPRRETLTKEEQQKLDELTEVLDRLRGRKNVQSQ